MEMWSCESELNRKTAHFRLPSVLKLETRELDKQQTFLIHERLPEVKFQASHLLRMPNHF